jgi:hypothetical protein
VIRKKRKDTSGFLPTVLIIAQQRAMATVSISIQLLKVANNSSSQRIEMNVAHQFLEVDVLLAENRFIPVLKQMSASVVAPVEAAGITA